MARSKFESLWVALSIFEFLMILSIVGSFESLGSLGTVEYLSGYFKGSRMCAWSIFYENSFMLFYKVRAITRY